MIKTTKLGFIASVLLASAIGLAGCVSENPYTEQKEVNDATKGAGIGAAAGAAVAGLATAGAGAVVGAAIGGGAVGGAIGYDVEKDRKAMNVTLRKADVSVSEIKDSNNVILRMPSIVHFQVGSAELSPKFKTSLNAVADVLKEYKYLVVQIPGYTDSIGTVAYNQKLSVLRAKVVADYLVAHGVSEDRIVYEGHGEMKPIASNATAKGRMKNRRVELILFAPPIDRP